VPRRSLLAAALAVLAASPAGAGQGKAAWRIRNEKGLFRCELPADWKAGGLPDGERGVYYYGGDASIRAELLGLQGSRFRSRADYLNSLPAPTDLQASTGTVAGRAAELYAWEHREKLGGAETRSHRQWVHEELLFLPQGEGFWALRFKSRSLLRGSKRGLEAWRRFLETFLPTDSPGKP